MRPTVTFVGRVGADPTLKFTQSGKAVASFRFAYTARVRDGDDWKDGQTTWLGVKAWGRLAENVAESVTKGTTVVVCGRIEQEDWETKDGEKRTSFVITADEVGMALSSAAASVQRNSGQRRPEPSFAGVQPSGSSEEDVF